MYSYAHSIADRVLVSLWSFTENTDEDYERLLSVWRKADTDARERDGLVHVMIVDAGNARPAPIWHRRMATHHNGLRSRHTWFALVSASPVVHGVVTAIEWLSKPSHVTTTTHKSVEEAGACAEAACGQPLPVLPALVRVARFSANDRQRALELHRRAG